MFNGSKVKRLIREMRDCCNMSFEMLQQRNCGAVEWWFAHLWRVACLSVSEDLEIVGLARWFVTGLLSTDPRSDRAKEIVHVEVFLN